MTSSHVQRMWFITDVDGENLLSPSEGLAALWGSHTLFRVTRISATPSNPEDRQKGQKELQTVTTQLGNKHPSDQGR